MPYVILNPNNKLFDAKWPFSVNRYNVDFLFSINGKFSMSPNFEGKHIFENK